MSARNKTGFEATIETMITYGACVGFDAASTSSVGSFAIMNTTGCVKTGPAILSRFATGRQQLQYTLLDRF
jgi:hypothetical protein